MMENQENYYGTNQEHDLDDYENGGYVGLFEGESDEFFVDLEDKE
jgi:hypothetical protein